MGDRRGQFRHVPADVRSQARPAVKTAIHYPPAGRHTHGRAVAKAVIRFPVIVEQPGIESSAITGIRVHFAVFFHGIDKIIFLSAIHDRFRNRAGHDGIIREKTILPEQREIFCFYVVPFVYGTDNIANDCSQHLYPLLFTDMNYRNGFSSSNAIAFLYFSSLCFVSSSTSPIRDKSELCARSASFTALAMGLSLSFAT